MHMTKQAVFTLFLDVLWMLFSLPEKCIWMLSATSWEVPVLITQRSCLFYRQLCSCNPSQFAWLMKNQKQKLKKIRMKQIQKRPSFLGRSLSWSYFLSPSRLLKGYNFFICNAVFWYYFQLLDLSHCWWFLLLCQGQQKRSAHTLISNLVSQCKCPLACWLIPGRRTVVTRSPNSCLAVPLLPGCMSFWQKADRQLGTHSTLSMLVLQLKWAVLFWNIYQALVQIVDRVRGAQTGHLSDETELEDVLRKIASRRCSSW